jgi:hypothetical protein
MSNRIVMLGFILLSLPFFTRGQTTYGIIVLVIGLAFVLTRRDK